MRFQDENKKMLSIAIKADTENAGAAEVSTYKLLSKDGTEIVKSAVLYIDIVETGGTE